MNRGIALMESYSLLENHKVSEKNMEIAIALGWAVELVQILHKVSYSMCTCYFYQTA